MQAQATINLPFSLGPSNQGLPQSGSISDMLQAAAANGGAASTAFFQQQYQVAQFVRWLQAQGSAAWVASTDESGPLYTATSAGASMVLATVRNDDVISGKQPAQQFEYDNQSYNIVGTVTATLSFNQQPAWYVTLPLGLADGIPVSYLATILWTSVLQPLLSGICGAVQSCFTGATTVDSMEAATTVADVAADDATVDAVVVTDAASVSFATGGLALVGIVVLIAIAVAIDLLLHSSYHNVKIYNLTPFLLIMSIPYIHEGTINLQPLSNGLAQEQLFSPGPNIEPVMVAFQADYGLVSSDEMEGIQYVMAFDVVGAETQGIACFDIPFIGDNSLYAAFASPSFTDYASVYSEQSGKLTQVQTSAAATIAQDVVLNMQVTYDYLDGEHETPGGSTAYFYNSLIVFSISVLSG